MHGYPFTGIGATDFRVSNREDLLLTISVFDDDLNQAVNMSGITLAVPASFTGNSWSVIDGLIRGTSSTVITIPTYPVGNQLSALALTTQPNLGILAGDQVTISDSTGLNTMTGMVVSYAIATGALVVQVGWLFEFEIRRPDPRVGFNGYVPWYDWGTTSEDHGALITAQLGNGITMIDVGYLQVRIPASTMWSLHGGTYEMALVGTDGFDTREIMHDVLHVIPGGIKRNAFATSNTSASSFGSIF